MSMIAKSNATVKKPPSLVERRKSTAKKSAPVKNTTVAKRKAAGRVVANATTCRFTYSGTGFGVGVPKPLSGAKAKKAVQEAGLLTATGKLKMIYR